MMIMNNNRRLFFAQLCKLLLMVCVAAMSAPVWAQSLANFSLRSVTAHAAYMEWDSLPGTTAYEVSYYALDNASDVATLTVSAPFCMLQGLQSEAEYLVQVRPQGATEWSVTVGFGTPCAGIGALAVGSVDDGFRNNMSPLDNYYKYSYSQLRYSSSALLGQSRLIDDISFFNTSDLNPRTVNVYMGHLDASTSTSYQVPISDMTLVYSGQVTSVSGRVQIQLTTPFMYDGVSDLVIVVDDQTGTWYSQTYFAHTVQDGCSTLAWSSDDSPFLSRTNYLNYLETVPVMEIGGDCTPPACESRLLVAPEARIGSTTVQLLWSAGLGALELLVEGNGASTSYQLDASTTQITLTGLTSNTRYAAKLRQICGGDTSTWSAVALRTTPLYIPIIYVDDDATGSPNGASWATAYRNIEEALELGNLLGQRYGQYPQIWVAEGVYRPGSLVNNGCQVYGGLLGNESDTYDMALRQLDEHYSLMVCRKLRDHHGVWDGVAFTDSYYDDDDDNPDWASLYYLDEPGEDAPMVLDHTRMTHCVISNISFWSSDYLITSQHSHISNCLMEQLETENLMQLDGDTVVNNTWAYCRGNDQWLMADSAVVRNNIFYGSEMYAIPDITNTVFDHNAYNSSSVLPGNILIDTYNEGDEEGVICPRLIRPEWGYYMLRPDSPLLDAGADVGLTGTDLMGRPRVSGSAIDLGCYEWDGTPYCGAPRYLEVSDVRGTSARFEWDNFLSSTPEMPVTSEVWVMEVGSDNWTLGASTTDEYATVHGLNTMTRYAVRVRQQCGTQWSSWSDTIQFTTKCLVNYDELTVVDAYYRGSSVLYPSGYRYEYSQSVYPAEMLGTQPRIIDTLMLKYYTTSSYALDLSVSMGLVDRSNFDRNTNFVSDDSLTQVFSGLVTFTPSSYWGDWIKIPLDTPIVYDGYHNLVLAIDNNTGTTKSVSFYYRNYSEGYSLYATKSDNLHVSDNDTRNRSTELLSLMLPEFCDNEGCINPEVAVDSITATSAQVSWDSMSGTPLLQVSTDGFNFDNVPLTAADIAASRTTISGLDWLKNYVVRMACVCGSGDTSLWTMKGFTTIVPQLDRIYVMQNATGNESGTSWSNAVTDLERALEMANSSYQNFHMPVDLWVAEGLYVAQNKFVLYPGVNVYGGFVGNEPADYDVSLRDWRTHETELNCAVNNYANVVERYAEPGEAKSRLDGLVVRNHKGGLHVDYCDVSNILLENMDYGLTVVGSPTTETYTDGNGNTRKRRSVRVENVTQKNVTRGSMNVTWGTVVNCLSQGCEGGFSVTNSDILNATAVCNANAGILAREDSYVANCVAWGNYAGTTTGRRMQVLKDESSVARNNAIEGLLGGNYVSYDSYIAEVLEDNYYISADNEGLLGPHFVHPGTATPTAADDWHLASGSACAKRGEWDAALAGLVSSTDDFDLGCYQGNVAASTLPSYSSHVYVHPDGTGYGTSWSDATASLSAAAAIAAQQGLDVWAAAGTYEVDTMNWIPFTFGAVHVYGSLEGNEPANYDLNQRDLAHRRSVIDGMSKAMCVVGHNMTMDGFDIVRGESSFAGGAAVVDSATFVNCHINNNSSSAYSRFNGGAIWASNQVNLVNCQMLHNGYLSRGYSGQFTVSSSYTSKGGAVYAPHVHAVNTLFAENMAAEGSAIYTTGNDLQLVNCDIVRNGGQNTLSSSGARLANCIVWGNENLHTADLNTTDVVEYSGVENGFAGVGNISLNSDNMAEGAIMGHPAFVNPEANDYSLMPVSVCVDAGSITRYNMDNLHTDVDAKNDMRVYGSFIDMGCFEFTGMTICREPSNLHVEVNGAAATVTWNNNVYTADYQPGQPNNGNAQLIYRLADSTEWDTLNIEGANYALLGQLTPTSNYELAVRSLCDSGYTDWVSTSFATECLISIRDVEVGAGMTHNTQDYLPARIYYKYSYTQQIITRQELGSIDTINQIQFKYTGSQPITRNWTVYVGNVWLDAFANNSSWVGTSAMTQVFSGNVSLNSSVDEGWVTVNFSTPFVRQADAGMVVAVDDNTGSYKSGCTFSAHYAGSNKSIYIYSDNINYNPSSVGSGTCYTYRNDMRIPGKCVTEGCVPPLMAVRNVAADSAVIDWSNADQVEVSYKKDNGSWTTFTTSTTPIVLNNLCHNSTYSVRLRSLCDDDVSSNHVELGFTTPTKPLQRLYVKTAPSRLGDGSSWENATDDLEWALHTAKRCQDLFGLNTDVWVAEGTYTGHYDERNSFEVLSGVNVYGGFVGYELDDYDLDNRDFEAHATVLTGESMRRVLYQPYDFNRNNKTVWDGFTLRDGYNGYFYPDNGNLALMRSYSGLVNIKVEGESVRTPIVVMANSDTYYDEESQSDVTNNYTSVIKNLRLMNCNLPVTDIINVSHTAVLNSLIANNSTGSQSNCGVISMSSSLVMNSTIVGNTSGDDQQGGIVSANGSRVYNTIIWGNRVADQVPVLNCSTSDENFHYCAIEGGPATNNCITLPSANNGTLPIFVNFVNPSYDAGVSTEVTDYHLTANSVCVNAGYNNIDYLLNHYHVWLGMDKDLNGEARIKFDSVDIGCYESGYSHTPLPNYRDGIIYVNANNPYSSTNNGTTWDSAFTSLESAIETASRMDSITVWVAAGTYTNDHPSSFAFTVPANMKLYGGFAGNEPSYFDLSLRNLAANPTILSGVDEVGVLSLADGSLADGFVITDGMRNSNSQTCGGVLINNATLRNCIVRDCSGDKGGALKLHNALVEDCQIYNNSGYYGGAIYCEEPSWVTRCHIYNNEAAEGGAVYGQYLVMSNCLVEHNASRSAYGVYSKGRNYFVHTTFAHNYALSSNEAQGGNLIYESSNYEDVYDNCVMWGNRRYNGDVASVGGSESYWGVRYLPEMNHTAIEGGFWASSNCMTLLSANYDASAPTLQYPIFRQPELRDYQFDIASPCIDAARSHELPSFVSSNTIYNALSDTLDLLGNPRVHGNYADMGCYEHQGQADCTAPYPIRVVARDGYSAILSWERNTPSVALGYQFSYSKAGQGNWVTVTLDGTPRYMLEGLTPETDYWVRVRTLCQGGVYGEWSPVKAFKTDCPMRSHPIVATGSDPYENRNGDLVPFSTYFSNTANFVITAAEMDSVPRTIDSISFQYIHGEPMTQKLGVYIRPCDQYTYLGMLGASARYEDLVFYGEVTFDSTNSGRWNGIKFDTPYQYDGRTDLMVKVINSTTGINATIPVANRFATHKFPQRQSSYTKILLNNSDSLFDYRPNFRLPGQCDSMDCLTGLLSAHDITTHSVLLMYNHGLDGDSVQMQLRRASDPYFTDIDTTGVYDGISVTYGNNSLTLNNLDEYTTYEVQMRSICDGGIYGEWKKIIFVTDVSMRDKVYVKPRAEGSGEGSSWDNAMGDISHAAQLAMGIKKRFNHNAQVWVAEGVYYGDTTRSDEEAAAFYFAPGVEVYGGFVGNEPASYNLGSRDLQHHQSVLDGRNARRVLTAHDHLREEEAAVMDGFVIRKGKARRGGGVWLKRHTALRNCDIHSNYASVKGGGVYVEGNFYVVQSGIYSSNDHVDDYSTTLANCHIHNNRSASGGGVAGNSVAMVNCLVNNNTAQGEGGGLLLDSLCHFIVGSTIVRNYSQSGLGAGISTSYTFVFGLHNYVTLYKSVVWGNRSATRSRFEQIQTTSAAFSARDVAVEGGTDYFTSYYLSPDNEGHFFSPCFVQPTPQAGAEYSGGDWHLGQQSFCINLGGGDPWYAYEADVLNQKITCFPYTDIEGNARTMNDTIDVGCYESPLPSKGKPVYGGRMYVTPTGAGNQTGNSWQNAASSIAMAQNLAKVYDVNTIWVAQGTYYGDTSRNEAAFKMLQGLNLYAGFEGTESSSFDANSIDYEAHPTILDGRGVHRVLEPLVANRNNITPSTWTGFTIRNGRNENNDGGGAILYGGFRLKNCVVENCYAINGGGVYMGAPDVRVRPQPTMSLNSSPVLTGCKIRNNRATGEGGGVYAEGGYMENCLVYNNRANVAGGVMAEGSIIKSTNVVNNLSVDVDQEEIGVGLHNPNTNWNTDNRNMVYNSVFWNNNCGLAHSVELTGNLLVNNTAVEGGYSGSSNIALARDNDGYSMGQYYARFADPLHHDYALTEYSDLVNQGSNSWLSGMINTTTDMAGNNRVFDGTIDMGAYESQIPQSVCPGIVGLTVDTVTTHTATLHWHPMGDVTSWMVRYGVVDGESDTAIVVNDTLLTLTGLHHFRHYTLKVRSVCDDGLTSSYSAAVTFDTECDSALVSPLAEITYFYPPQDEVVDTMVDFSWTSLMGATSYDLYLWSGDSLNVPSEPFLGGLRRSYVNNVLLPYFEHDKTYYWKVVAWNECRAHESRTVSFVTNGTPWLHVTEIQNSYPMSGHEMTVSWTVRNDGTGRTQPNHSWYDKIYLSRYCDIRNVSTESLDQVLLARVVNPRWLMPGESYTVSHNVRIPDTIMNDYYLFVITGDQEEARPNFVYFNDSVAPDPYEPNLRGIPYPYIGSNRATISVDGVEIYTDIDGIESMIPRYVNDQFFYKTIQIAQSPLPDLKVMDIQHPTNLFSNTVMPVRWTVTNHGQDDAEGNWTDRVVLVPAQAAQDAGLVDPIFGIRGTASNLPMLPSVLTKDVRHSGGLMRDSSYTVNTTLEVPLNVFGDFYMYVYTDSRNEVYESTNISDNAQPSAYPIHITLHPTPDLVVESIEAPEGVDMLDTISVKVRIKNQGTGDIDSLTNRWTAKLYYTSTNNEPVNRSLLRSFGTQSGQMLIARDSVLELSFEGCIPDNYTGSLYFFAEADVFENILEYEAEDNNTLFSPLVEVRYPDLAVSNIVVDAPDSVSASTGFYVEYDVTNVGTGKAHRDTWRDGIYLAHSNVFHFAAAERVKVHRRTDGLEKDESYHVRSYVQVPGHISGHWYVHVYTDFDSTLFERGLEDNNHLMSSRQLTILQSDLQICDVNVPSEAQSGVPTSISYNIKNAGRGVVSGQDIVNYVLYDGVVIDSQSVTINSLEQGMTQPCYAQITLPCTDHDSSLLSIRVDATDRVVESVENNNEYATPFRILSPDLSVSQVSIDDSVASGSHVVVRWRLSNSGYDVAPNTRLADGIYLSRSHEEPDTLGYRWVYEHTVGIGQGETQEQEYTLEVPEDADGRYYLWVVTNQGAEMCEGADLHGNAGRSDSTHVMWSPVANLVADSLSMVDWGYSYSSVDFSYRISNIGDTATRRAFVNKLYLSPAPDVYFAEGEIYSHTVGNIMAAGESRTIRDQFIVPSTLPVGIYYVHSVVDCQNDVFERGGETDNHSVLGTFDLRINPFDLVADSIYGVDTLTWGQTGWARVSVTNNSSMASSSTREDRLYLSADTILDAKDYLLSAAVVSGNVDPGQHNSIGYSFETPWGYDSVSYLIASVDHAITTEDFNYFNNVVVKPVVVRRTPVADLAVSSIEVIDDTVICGQPSRMAFTVTNQGEADVVSKNWRDVVYLSADSNYSSSDIPLHTSIHNRQSLAVGESYTDTVTFTVPIPNNGQFFLVVKAHADKMAARTHRQDVSLGDVEDVNMSAPSFTSNRDFYEHDMANNYRAESIMVGIVTPGDLVVRNIDMPDSAVLGETVMVSWDVMNKGQEVVAGDNLASLVYISADTLFGPDDRMVGQSQPVSIDLASGEYVQQRTNIRLSGLREGDYYMIVLTDVANAFYEVSERNNFSYSSLPISISVRELPFNTPVVDTFHNMWANDYKLNVGDETNQTVRVYFTPSDTNIQAGNNIYITYNSMGDNLNYTYSSIGTVTNSPEAFIPNTMVGYYGVSVYGSAVDSLVQHGTIEADIMPFQVMEVSPNFGGNTGNVTVALKGSRFRPGMHVWLSRGGDTIVADQFTFVDYYRGYATFNLSNADTGRYDLGVSNLCEGEAQLPQCFTVQPGLAPEVTWTIRSTSTLRTGRSALFTIEFANNGNVDVENKTLLIESPSATLIGLTPEQVSDGTMSLRLPLKLADRHDLVLPPGSKRAVTMYALVRSLNFFNGEIVDAKDEEIEEAAN